MKKLAYNRFGGIEVLELIDAPIPEIGAHAVLVKVKAAAINPVDWKMRAGELKLLSGRKFPQGSGLEFSGIVEKIGKGVTQYKVGNEVFGAGKNCMAEYVVADVKKICLKPTSISHEQASVIPVVGITAHSIFTKLLTITHGMEVLINGATGGIGMFATQMAKNRGAIVTAVVSGRGVVAVKRWGADHIIDYKVTDILQAPERYDVVVELSDKLSFRNGRRLLKEKGYFVASLPNPKEIVAGLFNNIFSQQKYKLVGGFANEKKLLRLVKEIEKDHLDILVGKVFSLSDYQDAYSETQKGAFLGKVVFQNS